MPEEERTNLRQRRHRPLRDPHQETLSNPPQLPGLRREDKTQTCCQS